MSERFPKHPNKESTAKRTARLARIGLAALALGSAVPSNMRAPEGEMVTGIRSETESPALTLIEVETDPILKAQYEEGERIYTGEAKYLKEQMLHDPQISQVWERYKEDFRSILSNYSEMRSDDNDTLTALNKLATKYGSDPHVQEAFTAYERGHLREYLSALATFMAVNVDAIHEVEHAGTWGTCLESHHRGDCEVWSPGTDAYTTIEKKYDFGYFLLTRYMSIIEQNESAKKYGDHTHAMTQRNSVLTDIAHGKFDDQVLAKAHFVPVWTSGESRTHKITGVGDTRYPFMYMTAHFEHEPVSPFVSQPVATVTPAEPSPQLSNIPRPRSPQLDGVRTKEQSISPTNTLIAELIRGHKYPVLKKAETEWKSSDKYPFYQHVAQAATAAAHSFDTLAARAVDDQDGISAHNYSERARELHEIATRSLEQAREAIAHGPEDRRREREAYITRHEINLADM